MNNRNILFKLIMWIYMNYLRMIIMIIQYCARDVKFGLFLLFNLKENKLLLVGFSYSHFTNCVEIFRWIFERFNSFDAIFLMTTYIQTFYRLY